MAEAFRIIMTAAMAVLICLFGNHNDVKLRFDDTYGATGTPPSHVSARVVMPRHDGTEAASLIDSLNKKLREEKNALIILLSVCGVFVCVSLAVISRQRRQCHVMAQMLGKLTARNGGITVSRPQDKDAREKELEASDIYRRMRKRLSEYSEKKQGLTESEWEELDREVNRVYKDFRQKLNDIYETSVPEYRICLLVKAGIHPTGIAHLANYSKESVTAIRRRLYKKAFGDTGRHASPAEWDKVIRSL